MKLLREDLKGISAGATAVEAGLLLALLQVYVVNVIDKIKDFFNG